MTIKNICIHHSGGLGNNNRASTQSLTAHAINQAHRDRWNYISTLGYYGGYNFHIDQSGTITQFRAIGEETMAQIGHNFDTVSICLSGNFSGVDTPTESQIASLKYVMFSLLEKKHEFAVVPGTEISIGWGNIYPHRVLQPFHTECNGTSLPDDWGRKFMVEYLQHKLGIYKSILTVYIQLLSALRSLQSKNLGSNERECSGNI